MLGDAKIALRSGNEEYRLTAADVHGGFQLNSSCNNKPLNRRLRRSVRLWVSAQLKIAIFAW